MLFNRGSKLQITFNNFLLHVPNHNSRDLYMMLIIITILLFYLNDSVHLNTFFILICFAYLAKSVYTFYLLTYSL